MSVPSASGTDEASAAAMKRALATIERLQRRIEQYEGRRFEPVAIIGMGCRFPGGVVDARTYWDLLASGTDAVTEVPADRWDADAFYDGRPRQPGKMITRWGGFLDRIDRFDHDFFGISAREARYMDPQQRLALEVAWEALEDAGIAPDRLAGSHTGVFLGIAGIDYASQLFADPAQIAAHAVSGTAHAIATGRLSYLLDLRGPSVALDTACSSSLVAVHQAAQSIRLGESDLAICGAVNVVLSPQVGISMSQLPDSLAQDGRCKAFDASADGYVRAEGCGIVILKRLADALRDGDRVLAVIRGSVVNQDGRSAGLTAPNGAAQRALLERALQVSGVRPEQVSYIETHGTGTKLGDPIEADALAEVFGRPDGPPLYLGSVKTNLGHLEVAAGMAGLIKTVLCLQHAMIPPNLHFKELNPHISFDGTTFVVPTSLTPWPGEGRRIAGVSSFGLSGTNAHMVLEQAPEPPAAEPDESRPRSVLALSAKSETALVKLARRYQDRLTAGDPGELPDVCYSASTGRSHFPYRLAAVGRDAAEVAGLLADYARGEPGPGLALGRAPTAGGPDVVFLFSGAGPQHAGMARELYRTQPTFRRVLDECAEILQPVLPVPLLQALYPEHDESPFVNDLQYAMPGLFAVEYALAELWRSWGVQPAAVLGHSFGEYTAACVAGVMSLADGLHLAAERGRLLQLTPAGAMASIFAGQDEVAGVLAGHDPGQVAIAAINGPQNTTISGVPEVVAAVAEAFTARGVKVKHLRIPRSGHSPLIEPALAPLREALRRVTFAPPRIPLVSNVTGQLWPWDEAPDADYWCRHMREPVRYADGVRALFELGYHTFLEVGPGTNLLGMAGEILPAGGEVLMLPSLRSTQDDWEVLSATVAQLYVHGVELDWAGFDRDYHRRKVPLPHYPFDQVRCWHDLDGTTQYSWLSGAAPSRTNDADAPGAEVRAAAATRVSTLPSAQDLLALPESARVDTLIEHLVRSARIALGSRSSNVDIDEPLSNLGLDSLMAVELRNEIQSRLGVAVTVASFLNGASIRSVATEIVGQLQAGRGTPGDDDDGMAIQRVKRVEDVASELLAQIERLPDSQQERADD